MKKAVLRMFTLFVLACLLMLPTATALQISNVRTTAVTDRTAIVEWTTDEPSDSFVNYGQSAQNLQRVGDAGAVTTHQIILQNLQPETDYLYSVESNNAQGSATSNNQGSLHTFTTTRPDTSAPDLDVEIPEFVGSNQLDLTGTTEPGVTVTIFVNGILSGTTTVTNNDGTFSFTGIFLQPNQENEIRVVSTDPAGNAEEVSGTIFSDTARPQINLQELPGLVTENTITLNADLSEEADFEIFVNNRSVERGSGSTISESVRLEEGRNTIALVVTDQAGQQARAQFQMISDTKAPEVDIEFEKGREYYDSRSAAISLTNTDFSPRAQSTITGTTEPGASVFLYVFRPLQFEFQPDFSQPREVATADASGNFVFPDVDFSISIADRISEAVNDPETAAQKFAPSQVPSGLERVSIFPIEQVSGQQSFTYYIYVIAEDAAGKTGYAQEQIKVNTCFSTDLAFAVQSVPQFQAPYALSPQLMDDGRQQIQTVFNLSYQGTSQAQFNANNQQTGSAYRVNGITIEPACTQSLQDDDVFGLGCRLLPRSSEQIPNNDKTSVYATWKLHASEDFSDRESNFWEDFKERQLIFPVKLTIRYQERANQFNENSPEWTEQKVQTSCHDLGYFVDIPVDSSELSSIILADQQIDAVNATLGAIQTIKPFLEKAYLFVGVGCMGSFLFRTVARWARIFTAKTESYFSTVKKTTEAVAGVAAPANNAGSSGELQPKCEVDQTKYYLDGTLRNWHELLTQYGVGSSAIQTHRVPLAVIDAYVADGNAFGDNTRRLSLDFNCPSTATAWAWEAGIDQAYRWTCDRAFCRAVPAAWTETKDVQEINTVILEQQQCAVTGRGVPLIPRENCQEIKKAQILQTQSVNANTQVQITQDINKCWQDPEGHLYYDPGDAALSPEQKQARENGYYTLKYFTSIQGFTPPITPPDLKVYKPQGADNFVVAKDITCNQVCTQGRKGEGFSADTQLSYSTTFNGISQQRGCYKEDTSSGSVVLRDRNEALLGSSDETSKRYAAGYTSDCFIQETTTSSQPDIYQCVCQGQKIEQPTYFNSDNSLRTAIAKDETSGTTEEWSYRQDRIFKETQNTKGTYYPETRYYSGRDLSGAFGLDYALDIPRNDDDKKVHEVNPHTQFLGKLQSVCLSGILKDLRLLESILQGYQACLQEAKVSGLQDAGMCKTWFTQNVCGLVYKAVAYASNELQCSPLNFDDVAKEGPFADVGAIVSRGFEAIPEALDSSISDVRDDYGNAQLNQYFQQGTQGFVQSMCLAALGYEFPLVSEDFLLDAAYSFPSQTSVVIAPAERELTTYNPARQTAVFNYNIGSVVFPGCKIKRWQVALKCIGPEDLEYSSEGSFGVTRGVDQSCGGQGCDCLNVQGQATREANRERIIAQGFDAPSGRMLSIPLESPVTIRDSTYRYDHVVLRLELDQSEAGNAEKCFDQGYRQGNTGIFYTPLVDTSPPSQLSCRANVQTGEFICPQLTSLFGFGSSNLEEPYVTCFDDDSGSWVSCQTPNLFLQGDEIRTRVHLNVGENGACLKRTVSGVPGIAEEIPTIPIFENSPGPLTIEQNLGVVTANMFGGTVNTLRLVDSQSNNQCAQPTVQQPLPQNPTTSSPFTFSYNMVDNTNVELFIPVGVNILTTGYTRDGNNKLQVASNSPPAGQTAGDTQFTVQEINQIQFEVSGFRISGVLGNVAPNDQQKQCTFQVLQAGSAAANSNARNIAVTYQLLEKDEGGSCALATQPVQSNHGRASHTQQVRIQLRAIAEAAAVGLVNDFNRGNYETVITKAALVVNENLNTYAHAEATFYSVSSFILLRKSNNDYKNEINQLLDSFFTKEAADGYVASESLPRYQKIKQYMCDYDKQINPTAGKYSSQC